MVMVVVVCVSTCTDSGDEGGNDAVLMARVLPCCGYSMAMAHAMAYDT